MKTQNDNSAFLNYLHHFINDFDKHSEQQFSEIAHRFKELTLKKNQLLVDENQICPYFCFVESGILQHAILVETEEKTTYLALRNSVTSSLNSFLNKIPSRKSIKALVDCQLWVIDLENFQDLLANNQVFHQFYYRLIERQIMLLMTIALICSLYRLKNAIKNSSSPNPNSCKKCRCTIWLLSSAFRIAT